MTKYGTMMHPHIVERFKCEFESENNGRRRSWVMFLGSQHFKG
jgi:hypothetical protein